jgi:hypothetical protein
MIGEQASEHRTRAAAGTVLPWLIRAIRKSSETQRR